VAGGVHGGRLEGPPVGVRVSLKRPSGAADVRFLTVS
jgi:hypothetical protein